MSFIANARMYSVTPQVEAAWQALLAHVEHEAGMPLAYTPYPAPQPLENLWARSDLGCVFMCGYPIALKMANVVPIAAPIPSLAWAQGRHAYRSDFIVRRDSKFQTLADTFGGTFGWTVAHSHSGFNAPRHHLLQYRTPERPKLYQHVKGNLITARAVLDAVLAGEIDTGPLDAYWHALIARHKPELTQGIRVVAATALAPIPAFVASPALGPELADKLRNAFVAARHQRWLAPLAATLMIEGFAPVTAVEFASTLTWHQDALAASYSEPG